MEKHTVSRLVGLAARLRRLRRGGQLTEAVRRKPFSVVLFDEIERPPRRLQHPAPDPGGRAPHRRPGRMVDFKNTVIIMTSNLGTADLRRKAIGFTADGADVGYQQIKDKVTEALKRSFRPEFLNRIDEVIVFHELTMAEVGQIVELMMARCSASCSPGPGADPHRPGQTAARHPGLRPPAGRPAPAAGHPAAARGPALREGALHEFPAGPRSWWTWTRKAAGSPSPACRPRPPRWSWPSPRRLRRRPGPARLPSARRLRPAPARAGRHPGGGAGSHAQNATSAGGAACGPLADRRRLRGTRRSRPQPADDHSLPTTTAAPRRRPPPRLRLPRRSR